MAKKALCCAINQYPPGLELRGCVNDARGWGALLKHHYDFTDIQYLLDDAATKRGMLDAMKALLVGAWEKDVLVFQYSGHGTYTADTSGDEPRYDECLCPVDIFDNLVVDDELRELFGNLPKGVWLTVITDSCFSGTVTRAMFTETLSGFESLIKLMPHLRRMLEWRIRYANPLLLDMPQRAAEILENPLAAKPKRMMYAQSTMNHILVSGCQDNEYSYDAKFGDAYYGAMSYAALQAIKDAKYRLTYAGLGKTMNRLLKQWGYPQTPQIEGVSHWKRRQLFV